MPFSSDFDDVYQIGIKETCQAAGAYCERVDEQIYTERMLDRIYNQIAKADLIIADMTGRNANVFYEVGYAHALGKPTVLLTRNVADIPFDLTQFPHIVYESKLAVLREKLAARVAWHVEHPSTSLEETSFPLEIFIDGKNPLRESIKIPGEYQSWVNLDITVHNQSPNNLSESDFKIGFIVSQKVSGLFQNSSDDLIKSEIDGEKTQYVLVTRQSLMPGEFQTMSFSFHVGEVKKQTEQQALVRLFTTKGFRDFPFEWPVKRSLSIVR